MYSCARFALLKIFKNKNNYNNRIKKINLFVINPKNALKNNTNPMFLNYKKLILKSSDTNNLYNFTSLIS